MDPRFTAAVQTISEGKWGDPETFAPIVNALSPACDYYLLSVDFPSYIEAQDLVDATYKQPAVWLKKSIMSTAGSGKFSSDRTIKQYADEIWNIKVKHIYSLLIVCSPVAVQDLFLFLWSVWALWGLSTALRFLAM